MRAILGQNSFGLGGCNSAAECLLPKQKVEGSNPFTRSSYESQGLSTQSPFNTHGVLVSKLIPSPTP